MSRLRKAGTASVMAVALVGSAEGLRQTAYPDPGTHGKPWTICYGHAKGDVSPGDHKSLDECRALLLTDLDGFGEAVDRCIHVPMKDETFVAYVSLAYNIGAGSFCKSSVARLANAGQGRESCDAMLRFNRAAGVVFPGLTARRQRERAFCLHGMGG